ncbi:MAG: hypothetical protein GY803_19140 [Chloroflexi bacterium]|nr:hypothetical protein [Chloroflexota bacterium]
MNEKEYTIALLKIRETYDLDSEQTLDIALAIMAKAGGAVLVSEIVTVVLVMVDAGKSLGDVEGYLQ